MQIIKNPSYEDDSYYFIIDKSDSIKPIEDSYMAFKRYLFSKKYIDKKMLSKFYNRTSFKNIDQQEDLSGTIYTYSCEVKNNMDLDTMLDYVSNNKDISRRCVIRLVDSLCDYSDDSKNTSCLNIIHYYRDTVKLFFRASDMSNELLHDINLIKLFFIDPVFIDQPEIHIIASTAQNIINPKNYILE